MIHPESVRQWEAESNGLRDIIGNLRAENNRLRDLVQTLLDNDPDEPIADNGMTVLDGWRECARKILGKA